MRKSILAVTAGLLLLAGPAALLGTSGCSAAKNVINSNIPDIDNPVQLRGKGIKSRVVRNRAFVNASGEITPYSFNDINVPSRETLSSGELRQRLNSQVAITVPGGPPPQSVTMRNFRLIVTLTDANVAERQIQFDMRVDGDVVFTATGGVDGAGRPLYSTESVVEFTAPLNNEGIDRLTSIIATANPDGSPQNNVSAILTCEVDDETLPNGTTELDFTFGEGSAEVKI